MPHNRQASIRYQAIDRCLQQRDKKWTAHTLAEACAEAVESITGAYILPSRSTIARDIRLMRRRPPIGYNAPIEWDAREGTYYYAERKFSIFNVPLSETDMRLLDRALDILRQFRHFSQAEGLELLATKLQHALKLRRRQARPIIALSHSPATPAHRWLDPLYRATEQEHCLKLEYRPFVEPPIKETVSPYLLKEYNSRWFLIGYSHGQHLVRTYALDRIQSAEEHLLQPFQRTPHFNPNTYFNDIIGVSLPEDKEPVEVLFRATPLRARYILTKPMHTSLRVCEETPGYTLFSLRLIPNTELEHLILSFGEEVQVLQPQWLAQRIERRLREAVRRYEASEHPG
ncbi:MAG: WYL domain-containing protein [Phaeodactylibacter sp.]|nr:WYL domain-containing protein [Phaeodactylibacter sp.]